jgi:hypothetical protein
LYSGEDGLKKKELSLKNIKAKIIIEGKEPKNKSDKFCVRMKSPKMPEVEFDLIELEKEIALQSLPKEKKVFPKSIFFTRLQKLIQKYKDETPPDEYVYFLINFLHSE